MRTSRLPMSTVFFLGVGVALRACGGEWSEGGGGGGGEPGARSNQDADRRVLVEAAPVEQGTVADYLETTGSIESEAQADVAPETSGVVTRIAVEEGDSVRRGQLLAVIENPSLSAGADRALIELDRAKQDLERARALHRQGAISDADLRQSEISYRTAKSTADEARQTQGFTRLTSPVEGTVAVRDIRLGELASSAARAFQVVDLARLRVIVQLPEKDLGRVRVGQPVRLSSAYDEDASATGAVARISPVVVPVDFETHLDELSWAESVLSRVDVDRDPDRA
ncbi:MAG: efflux RND transporter periplasmic adaptor subunit [Myxococcota bacterium]